MCKVKFSSQCLKSGGVSLKKKHQGKCCICGKEGNLTYEHVPPKSAFNSSRIKPYYVWEWLLEDKKRTANLQAGQGDYTLCESCNNLTGTWYGSAYADFAAQGMEYYNKGASGKLSLPYAIFPLRVFKQIVSCFASVNGPDWCEKNPAVRRFLLTPYEQSFPEDIDIRMYMHEKGKVKICAPSGQLNIFTHEMVVGSEWGFVPFSFICILGKDKTRHKLLDKMPSIKSFLKFRYDDKVTVFLDTPRFPCNPLPFDFRPNIPDIKDTELVREEPENDPT